MGGLGDAQGVEAKARMKAPVLDLSLLRCMNTSLHPSLPHASPSMKLTTNTSMAGNKISGDGLGILLSMSAMKLTRMRRFTVLSQIPTRLFTKRSLSSRSPIIALHIRRDDPHDILPSTHMWFRSQLLLKTTTFLRLVTRRRAWVLDSILALRMLTCHPAPTK